MTIYELSNTYKALKLYLFNAKEKYLEAYNFSIGACSFEPVQKNHDDHDKIGSIVAKRVKYADRYNQAKEDYKQFISFVNESILPLCSDADRIYIQSGIFGKPTTKDISLKTGRNIVLVMESYYQAIKRINKMIEEL